ncbi:Nudix [Glarea lozoyensis ATCC 20868]|uniref:Nudix n=1 Tax=Glarea lozoyensis (strain ATCC 20868 / MF5171) TaxID=1116229 RepID=S3CI22_GLAL2|nr:Nudix [Glarea lozoyensis ATCC 20868]EPE25500.1 Nudix [Glarea lozoyensis ATCC 20868]
MSEPATSKSPDRCYGILALRYDPSLPLTPKPKLSSKNTKLLLIHQNRKHAPTYWTIPKGHPKPEVDLDTLDTAIRELWEETKITISVSDIVTFPIGHPSPGEMNSHSTVEVYRTPGRYVGEEGKEVRYWVAVVGPEVEKDMEAQKGEVEKWKWCGWDEGMGLITYDEGREVLGRVRRAIDGDGLLK